MPKKPEKPVAKRASTTTRRRKAATDVAAAPPPPAELIARRAYQMFVAQGGSHGRDLDHWLAAEAELSRESA